MAMRRGMAVLGALGAIGFVAFSAALLAQDDDLASELPRIAAREPAESQATIALVPGFRLQLVASEPLVADPVSTCYDDQGRLYVVEMRGYPFPEDQPTGKIRRLEDRDGDGLFDHGTDFLTGLNWPTSVVPYAGGVFVAAAPDILYARDDNGDGQADLREVAYTGFGTQNVQALTNGLLWGPDGWIYGVSGGNGGEIVDPRHPDQAVSVRGRDFRFHPDRSAFEAISGGGQFGHAWDDWGHRFTCSNSNHINQLVFSGNELDHNPAMPAASVLVNIGREGPAAPVFRISQPEPWRVVRTRQRAADPDMRKRLPPSELVVTGFFTSATGVTVYRGSAFPPAYQGNAFVGDVGGNLIHRKRLEPHGPLFEAIRADEGREFLASTDNWFRPVNFANTPQGTLLVLDMYRETIEHPLSIPEPIKRHLDLTSGRNRGRLYELVPEGYQRPRLVWPGQLDHAGLVALLGHADGWMRDTAQRLLLERRDLSVVPLLRELARTRPTPRARMHALWTLGCLGQLTTDDALLGLADELPQVREATIALVDRQKLAGTAALAPRIAALASDADAMVRLKIALALGQVGDDVATPALATIVMRDPADSWIRSAVLASATGSRPLGLLRSLEADTRWTAVPQAPAWVATLAEQIGAGGTQADHLALLALAREANTLDHARAALVGLGRGLARGGQGSLAAMLATPAGLAMRSLFEQAAQQIQSPETSVAARVNAIGLLAMGPPELALPVLPGLLDGRQPDAVQIAALRALNGLMSGSVAPAILDHWPALGPAARREAAEVLTARPERIAALLDAIGKGTLRAAEIDPLRRVQLTDHPDLAIRQRARDLLARSDRPERQPVIDAYAPALQKPADPTRGREVFLKHCATCHQAEGKGVTVGPDLATVTSRGDADLLVHILDPNREVAPIFVTYTVALDDGRVATGIIAEESASTIVLKRGEGVTENLPRARIEAVASTGQTLMPENLETLIDPPAMADLIRYLRQIKATPSAP